MKNLRPLKYNKQDIQNDAYRYIVHQRPRAYGKLAEFAYGISEELAKQLMKKHGLSDEFILEEMRSQSLEHFATNFRKFDAKQKGSAASYIISMLRNSMIDYLRSLSRADKYGELNKSFAEVPDINGIVRSRLVQSKRDDYLSEAISDGEFGLPADMIDPDDIDFDNSYIYKKK